MPTLLVLTIIFVIWLTYEIRKTTEKQKQHTDAFWETEHQANQIRKQDISNLDYLTVPVEKLPFQTTGDATLMQYQTAIKELVGKPILNLTGYTNTQLKLNYGAANLDILSECDENFTILAYNIAKWGEYCYQNQNYAAAKTLFEYGVSIHTDISSNYILLGKIYLQEDNTDKIFYLIEQASDLNSLMKDSIITHLRELLEQNPTSDNPL